MRNLRQYSWQKLVRRRLGDDLMVRADKRTLPPRTTVLAGETTDILRAEGVMTKFRVIEIGSLSGLPFDVRVSWTGGHGISPFAWFSCGSAATRICIPARTIQLAAANLSTSENVVEAHISDGRIETRNVRVFTNDASPIINSDVQVPLFATHVRWEANTLGAHATISFVDGRGVVTSVQDTFNQSRDGFPIGDCRVVRLNSTTGGRLLFALSL
jgi:hypothetical protein